MSPVVMLPVLLLLLLGVVLLMKREKAKKALAAPAVDAVVAAPAEVPAAAPAPVQAPAADPGEALFMVEVWHLGLLGLGLVALLAGMAGMVPPLLGLVLVLGSVLAVVLKARAAKQQ